MTTIVNLTLGVLLDFLILIPDFLLYYYCIGLNECLTFFIN